MKQAIKILFADDEVAYARALPAFFRSIRSNYQFDFVHTIEEAIENLEENAYDYDLIVVDLKFKKEELAGLKIMRYLDEKLVSIPSIIITAYANQENLLECIQQRPYKLLEKPFDAVNLDKSIQVVLKKAAKQDEKPHLARTRKLLSQTTGRNKIGLILGALESLTSEEYEEVLEEIPAIKVAIQEEEQYKRRLSLNSDWRENRGKIPLEILNIANVSVEIKPRRLASGEIVTYGPFVYVRWMEDGKQQQYYAGKLEQINDPDLIEKLYYKYQKDEKIRKIDKLNTIFLLYKKYCTQS
ncbi:MAG: response regulator [Xenococcaceae cyanobacterium]